MFTPDEYRCVDCANAIDCDQSANCGGRCNGCFEALAPEHVARLAYQEEMLSELMAAMYPASWRAVVG